MGRKKIIHLDDERRPGHYVCNHATKVDPKRMTKNPEEVTCKNCLKVINRGGVIEHNYENSIGKILAMLTMNYSITDIAKALNMSRDTVYKYHAKHRAEEDKENIEHGLDSTKILEQKRRIIGDNLKHFMELQKNPKATKTQIIDAGSKLMSQIDSYEKTSNRLGYIGGETTTHEIKGGVMSIATAADIVARELEEMEMRKREEARKAQKAKEENDEDSDDQ